MKILTLRLPSELYDKLWQIHSDSRNNINSIIIELVEKGLNPSFVKPYNEEGLKLRYAELKDKRKNKNIAKWELDELKTLEECWDKLNIK
jgi:hypothetical protein